MENGVDDRPEILQAALSSTLPEPVDALPGRRAVFKRHSKRLFTIVESLPRLRIVPYGGYTPIAKDLHPRTYLLSVDLGSACET
jgi:hypothetical protein